MIKFLLIVFFGTSNTATSTKVAEYKTEDACSNAGKQFIGGYQFNMVGGFGDREAYAFYSCISVPEQVSDFKIRATK